MDSGIKIYRSNSSEKLLIALSELLREPVISPHDSECIVVQSNGMATWLSMNLSKCFGVWSNPDFPHPRQLIQRVLRASLGETGKQSKEFIRERLVFGILAMFPDILPLKPFAPLKNYLIDDSDNTKALQLAKRIAYAFDQYAIYRPDIVLAWEEGKMLGEFDDGNAWQAEFWRLLIKRLDIRSPAYLLREAIEQLDKDKILYPEHLPQRISLFGIASLPPVYLSLLSALAKHIPVHNFLLSPSSEYWSEIRSQKEINRQFVRVPVSEELDNQYFEIGNPLLASLGALGRDFQRLVEETTEYEEPAGELYEYPHSPYTALEVLQHDILHLVCRDSNSVDYPLQKFEINDHSIEIHACHSRMRELEVLHDQLLALLTGEDRIQPHDVIVMVPDIKTYAPLIDSVFMRTRSDLHSIPYRIADRPITSEAPVIEAFFRIFDLVRKRAKASEIMDLLSVQSLHKRFAITEDDLEQIHRWIDESGIRWGVDEEDRTSYDQPKDRQNTWAFGLDRLALGYAMPGNDLTIFNGILPYDEVEGQMADLLGSFMDFCEKLFKHLKVCSKPRPLLAWQTAISEILETFFIQGYEENWQLQKIRDVLVELVEDANVAGFDQDIDSNTLQKFLEERLELSYSTQGFLAEGVTFCAMLPMRSIPFQAICMLGMNDGEFPRVQYPDSFDLISQCPRLGDRSRRNDDQYLFLEALLAARKKLLISYVGMSIKDGSLLPPSVVVNHLIDCIADSFVLPSEELEQGISDHREKIFNRLVIKHPLQPFSSRYFRDDQDSRLFSYADDYCKASKLQQAGFVKKHPFMKGPISLVEEGGRYVSLADLQKFFSLPARWFVQKRLGLYLTEKDEELQDREPLYLTELDTFQIGKQLIEQGELEERNKSLSFLRGQGALPLGSYGDICFEQIYEILKPISEKKKKVTEEVQLENLTVKHSLPDNTEIVGELTDRYPVGLVRMTNAKLSAKYYLSAWLEHLFLCIEKPSGQELYTYLVGKGEKNVVESIRFAPVDRAENILADLVDLYWLGHEQPLLFFPKSSYKFAYTMQRGKGDEQQRFKTARKTARIIYVGDRFNKISPEGDEPHLKQLFGDDHPLALDYRLLQGKFFALNFESLAKRVFDPLIEGMEKV